MDEKAEDISNSAGQGKSKQASTVHAAELIAIRGQAVSQGRARTKV
jgi:hypothetical protein